MKKSKVLIIFSAICLMVIVYIIGVHVGRNEAIKNARLVEVNDDSYIISYGHNGAEDIDDECHEYIWEEE